MNTKELLQNSNFRNNQNYVLWKAEKKKLLSKFFIEKNILFLHNLDNWLFSFFTITIIYSIFISIYIYLFLIKFVNNFIQDKYIFILLYIIILLLTYIIINLFLNYKKIKKYNTLKLENYFLNKKIPLENFLIFYIITLLFVTKYFFMNFLEWKIFILYFFIFSFIFVLLFYFLKKIKFLSTILKIKFIKILFLPIYLSFSIIYSFFTFIYIFLINWTKWYKIIKKTFMRKLLTKFYIPNNNFAENNFYLISKK